MKGKVAILFLIFCLVAPIATTYIFLQFQKKQVKREIKWKMIGGIDKSELVLLKFSLEETETVLKWKHSKEFEYNHQMYDVVDKKIEGDSISYWCWWDHEETKLNKQLSSLVSQVLGTIPQRQDKQDKLLDFYKKLFCEEEKAHHYSFPISITKNFLAVDFDTIYHSPPVPPPRIS